MSSPITTDLQGHVVHGEVVGVTHGFGGSTAVYALVAKACVAVDGAVQVLQTCQWNVARCPSTPCSLTTLVIPSHFSSSSHGR